MKKYQQRNQQILLTIVGESFFVHNGRCFIKVSVNPLIVGFKFGAFVFTRKIGKNFRQKKSRG